MINITFITNTKGKAVEAQEILGDGFKVTHKKVDLDEIQTIDGKQVIEKKARKAYSILKKPVLVEDTSLYFNAWNGLPGALVRWFLDAVKCEGICKMMNEEKDRSAYAESALAYFDGKKMKIVTGRVDGQITKKPKGDKGFGWDPIFIPQGHTKTFGEMDMEEKSRISMRKLALEKLRDYLQRV
jgi:non-canonical purine NTP pyrophosphatase (RdgB/HAM1 family)